MSLVSVVIPCYNQSRFLGKAVESVLSQIDMELELIVVNDGSTDEIVQVASPFLADPRFRIINQKNAGLPAARNRGLRESTGTYINFLDSDDWLAGNMLRTLSTALDQNPEMAFAYCDIQMVDAHGAPGETISVGSAREVTSGDIFGSLVLSGYFPPQTVLLRRSVLDEIGGFDEQLGGHADYELWLRATGKGHQALYVDQKLAYYRVHDKNMSSNHLHMLSTRGAALQKISRMYPDKFGSAVNQIVEDREEMYRAHTWLNSHYVELKTWVDQLQTAKDWLDGQWRKLRVDVADRDNTIQSLRQRLKELEG
jgi:glycosyltransferase involved in cell wall biosynthesis